MLTLIGTLAESISDCNVVLGASSGLDFQKFLH